jgi:hypothetical protein
MKTILIKRSQGQQAHTDYYKKVAAQKLNIPYEQVTDEMRTAIKANEMAKEVGMQHPSENLVKHFMHTPGYLL